MDIKSLPLKKKQISYLFYGFVALSLAGIALVISETVPLFGYGLLTIGILLGIFCAITPCPYCSKMSGTIVKPMFGAVFPMGFCFHCGKAYLGKSDRSAS